MIDPKTGFTSINFLSNIKLDSFSGGRSRKLLLCPDALYAELDVLKPVIEATEKKAQLFRCAS